MRRTAFKWKCPVRSKIIILTPWCRVLLEKLTGLHLVKKFPAFYGTWRFITTLTNFLHPSLSWSSPVQSTCPQPTSWRSILILSTHLRIGLPSGLFPSGFPTRTLYAPLSSPIRARWPAHLILLDFITRTILGEECKIIIINNNIIEQINTFIYLVCSIAYRNEKYQCQNIKFLPAKRKY